MNVDEPLQRIINPDNLVDAIATVSRATDAGVSASVVSGNELFQDLGDQYGGRIISPSVDAVSFEPTDSSFSGAFLSGTEQVMSDATQDAWLAKINAGIVEFSVGVDGIYQNRLTNGYKHVADDGITYRRGLLGMNTLAGQTAPSFGVTYQDQNPAPTELIVNGGFETGDFTGWTAVSGMWTIRSGSPDYDGYYASLAVGLDGSSKTQIVSVTQNLTYVLTARLSTSSTRVAVYFYSGAGGTGTLLNTQYVGLGSFITPTTISKNIVAPSGAVSAVVEMKTYGAGIQSFDNISLIALTLSNYLGFEPVEGKLISNMLDANDAVGQVPVGAMTVPRVEEARDKITATVGAAGNVDVGTHYVVTVFVDAYGNTDADLTQSTAVVVATSAKTVALTHVPLGKWGTTSRQIYATIAGATQTDPTAYHLMVTIANNTETTATYNISDATLAAVTTTIPTINTTGSRPAYPRNATMWADEMVTAVTVTRTISTAQAYFYYFSATTANANDGDEYNFGFYLAAGEYTLSHLGVTSSGTGKADYYIDGVLQISAVDWYSPATVYNNVRSGTVTIPTSGYHHLLVKVNGRTGSDYVIFFTKIYLTPAAY